MAAQRLVCPQRPRTKFNVVGSIASGNRLYPPSHQVGVVSVPLAYSS